jgi:hypothetical protein
MSARIKEVVAPLVGFEKLPHADKLRLFAWTLHADGKEYVKASDFAECYDALHLPPPSNLHRAVQALAEQRDLLKSAQGYRLAKPVRDRHEAKYGLRPITVQVHELLASLPAKLSSKEQSEYLNEALCCFRGQAWRAAIIMAWNVAFDHLCEVVTGRLPAFNAGYAQAYPKAAEVIAQRSELRDMKESVVIRVCRTAGIIDKTQAKCLERNLEIRNDAAHPSGAPFNQLRAEAFILDVVQTIVLGLAP